MFLKAWIVLIASASLCQSIDAVQRIKDGQKIVRGDFTFTANIKRKGSAVCTALLVDRRWILTLPNCIKERSIREYTVYFTNSKDRKVKRTLRYVAFPDSKKNRVILVRLNKKLRRSEDNVRPFDRFISSNNERQLTNCKAVGYSPNGNLNEVKINIQPAKSCRNSEKKTTLCFDTVEGKVCEVDNGAPILCKLSKRDKKWYLTGLSSVTKYCKDESASGIRLSYFTKNIIKTINGKQKASDCGVVPIIPFGTAQLDIPMKTDVGSTATVSCQSGYETDIPIITCQEDGMWSATTCDEIEAVNALLGEPCKLDRDCIDTNSTCNNGSCACESGTVNITGDCTACVVSINDCVTKLNRREVSECIVCANDDCDKGMLKTIGSTAIDVLNRGAQCRPSIEAYSSSCVAECQSSPQCFWMGSSSITNVCIFYQRECGFRLIPGSTPSTFNFPTLC